MDRLHNNWHQTTHLPPKAFICGYCGERIASQIGYMTDGGHSLKVFIYICHLCNRPSLFVNDNQTPGIPFGEIVAYLPVTVEALYNEARNCMTVSAFTAAVLLCRKILMNVAVDLKAQPNKSFLEYVNYLSDKNYIPPNSKGWVDHIRNKGNEANHEIHLMSQTDAQELIGLTEMLLKIIYEFPNRVPGVNPTPLAPATP
ncbi:MAG TPA: DUF4145 domain-containing protein [Pyrinomonadaceae bacterium]|nr:DUF4145 domain-containing protein [Pyrinomonadaceae bacterium]